MMRALVFLLLLSALLPAWGQRSESYGPYQLYYNALPSGMLNDTVAREAGVLRSRARGVLMISLHHQGEPIRGRVEVEATDGEGRAVPVEIRRLRENDVPSYLGTFPVRDGQSIRFRLEITPEGSSERLRAGFTQQFFLD